MTGPQPTLGNWRDSPADLCRANGWNVGTHLVGDEGHGPTVIRITAIGETSILAVAVSHNGIPASPRGESSWQLACRDWQPSPVVPAGAGADPTRAA